MVRANQEVIQEIITHCLNELPNEACGVLLGTSDGESVRISGFVPMLNAAENPLNRFSFDPCEWVEIVIRQSAGSLGSISLQDRMVGIVHSHPLTKAIPSRLDENSLWSFATYWIVSLLGPNQPDIRAYRMEQGRFQQQQLKISPY
ncbi:Mov34/MPN/PAD-1 family protein [Paenibacillus sp. MBLB4367]|uniref:Mov34/MPN/PAD-1 family protein n=1 Tax=Paenibacillus sp. MBLB4367 TaxID=3384767 RepID=UPI00390839D3